uniref:Uncharacterized protein n=1 Tax=Strongyloides venezuelensis TaxID=75913 RepID=A0A0K0FQE2_STRVS
MLEMSIKVFIPPSCVSSSFTELSKYDVLLSQVINETIPQPSNNNEQLLTNSIKSVIKRSYLLGNGNYSIDIGNVPSSIDSYMDSTPNSIFEFEDDDNDKLNFCSDDINILPCDIDEYSEKKKKKQKTIKGSLIPTTAKVKTNKKVSISKEIKLFMIKSNLSPYNYKKSDNKQIEDESLKKTGIIVTTV